MRQWVAAVPLVAVLVVAGCMTDVSTEPAAIDIETEHDSVHEGAPEAVTATANATTTNATSSTPGPGGPPGQMAFEVPLFLFAHVAVAWERVAQFLPEGFAPAGHPYVPLLSVYWGTPEGTFADVMVAMFAYEQATVDGTPLDAGRIALAWATARPPDDYGHLYPAGSAPGAPAYVVLGATVTDPRVADALAGWGIDAHVGQIDTVLLPGPEAHATAHVCCAPFDLTLDVTQPTASPAGPGPDVRLVNFVPDGDDIAHALYNGLSSHKALVGPGSVDGTLGPLGQLTAAGAFAQIVWFGEDALTPSGVLGTFRFDHIAL